MARDECYLLLAPQFSGELRKLARRSYGPTITQLVAEKIIAAGRLGIEDAAEISKLVLTELGAKDVDG